MDIETYNAGYYEQHYQYKAFVPTEINKPWLFKEAALVDLLGRADRALGKLNAFAKLAPDIDFFIRMYVSIESTQSNRIEGTQTGIEDTLREAEDLHPELQDDWAEVHNYIEAINDAIHALDTLPLSSRLLRNTHKTMLKGVRGARKCPGEFRKSQNWIGVSLKDAMFVPPHHERIPRLMTDLEHFLNDTNHRVHPLIRIAIAHYQFETIHPFLDGNGRLGRLMISLFLASEKLLEKPALYLSNYFERHKTAYIDHLMAVRNGNHMRDWLVFFLQAVLETAQSSASTFEKILALKARIDSKVLPCFSTRRQANAQIIIRHLYARPIVTVKQVASQIGSTQNTASAFITDFITQGILHEMTSQRRNRLFVFREYLDLFR